MRIFIATSSFDHRTDDFVTASIARVARNFREHGHEVADAAPYSCLYIDQGRNNLTLDALGDGVDAILYWDSDQTLYFEKRDDLAALFNVGLVVTAPYISRHRPKHYTLYERTPDGWRMMTQEDLLGKREPFPVHKCGAGALWVRREVLTKIPPPWWIAGYHTKHDYVGEDMFFCDLVQSAGFQILCQPNLCTGHMTTAMLVHRPGGGFHKVPGQLALDEMLRIRAGDAIQRDFFEDV